MFFALLDFPVLLQIECRHPFPFFNVSLSLYCFDYIPTPKKSRSPWKRNESWKWGCLGAVIFVRWDPPVLILLTLMERSTGVKTLRSSKSLIPNSLSDVQCDPAQCKMRVFKGFGRKKWQRNQNKCSQSTCNTVKCSVKARTLPTTFCLLQQFSQLTFRQFCFYGTVNVRHIWNRSMTWYHRKDYQSVKTPLSSEPKQKYLEMNCISRHAVVLELFFF